MLSYLLVINIYKFPGIQFIYRIFLQQNMNQRDFDNESIAENERITQ